MQTSHQTPHFGNLRDIICRIFFWNIVKRASACNACDQMEFFHNESHTLYIFMKNSMQHGLKGTLTLKNIPFKMNIYVK